MDKKISLLKRRFEASGSFKDLFILNHALKRLNEPIIIHPLGNLLKKHGKKAFDNTKSIGIEFGPTEGKKVIWGRLTWEIKVLGNRAKPNCDHLISFFENFKVPGYKLSNYEIDYYGGATDKVAHERRYTWSRLRTRRYYVHYVMLKFNFSEKVN